MLRALGALVAVAVVVGLVFLVSKRRPAPVVAPNQPQVALRAPTAVDIDQALLLNIAVKNAPGFVYLYRVEAGLVMLEWAHPRDVPAWEEGEYEPEWTDGSGARFFQNAGTNKIVAVVSSTRLDVPDQLATQQLVNNPTPCAGCFAAQVEVTVTESSTAAAHSDAGPSAALAP